MDTAALAQVLSRYPEIVGAYLFGSAARGELRPDSDVDIGLVLRDPRTTALDCYRMLGDVASRLEGLADGRSLDLVVLDAQGPLFRHAVLTGGRRIYVADLARVVDFESETYSRAFDFRPTWEIATAGRLGGVRQRLASAP